VGVKRKRSPPVSVLEDEAEQPEDNEEGQDASDPYLDLNDYEAVPLVQSQVIAQATAILRIPSPPAPEAADPPSSAHTQFHTQQDALQNALEAWYAAGYATALFHVRSGLVE
jgi:hypothetical protein